MLRRFLELPLVETDRMRRAGITKRIEAVTFSKLMAQEILFHIPMRIANVSRLETDKTVILPDRGKPGETAVHIPRTKVKNGEPLHYFLPPDTTALLRFYIDKVKPLLEQEPSSWLFPNGDGGPIRPDTLSKQLSALVADKLGLKFNAHLVRHLIAKVMVDERPGEYEAPRRLPRTSLIRYDL